MEIIALSDISPGLNIAENRWKMLWQGSGTDEVPNWVTTIRWAAWFLLYVSVCRKRHWYVTWPSAIANLRMETHFLFKYSVCICPNIYRWTNAELSNKWLNSISPTFKLPGPFRNRLPLIQYGIVPRTFPVIGSTISWSHDLNQTVASQLGYKGSTTGAVAVGIRVDGGLGERSRIDWYFERPFFVSVVLLKKKKYLLAFIRNSIKFSAIKIQFLSFLNNFSTIAVKSFHSNK